jgi:prepilin-type N-terminal cleavage/methylation domain-containing protein
MMRSSFQRRGMTLVEIMIALVLLGIVSGVIMRVVMRQQRFYQGVNQIMTQRGQLRQGINVLPVDLRSLSSVGNDFIAVSDSAIEFDVNIGTAVVCAVLGGNQVVLPPLLLASKATLTTFSPGIELSAAEVARGVTVYIYNDSSTVGNFDDRWQKFSLASEMTDSYSDCLGGPFSNVSDAGQPRFVLTLSDSTGRSDPVRLGPVSQYIGVGAPVRIMKRVRYKLFQHTDSQWYLGYSEFDKSHGAYDGLTPVSGPYDAYATGSGAAPGFMFRFFDSNAVEVAPGAAPADTARISRIARIDIISRARTSSNVRAAGIQGGATQQYRDSLAVSVMVRNRQ